MEAPIVFIGTGEHFNDLEEFNAQSFVSRMLGRGDMVGLQRRAMEAGLTDKQPEMMKRMAKGQFTMRDLYDQFQNLLKMGGGSIGSLMQMIPGMSNMMNNQQMDMSSDKLQNFLTMMDSMTDPELDCVVPMSDDRVKRVARPSGSGFSMVPSSPSAFSINACCSGVNVRTNRRYSNGTPSIAALSRNSCSLLAVA